MVICIYTYTSVYIHRYLHVYTYVYRSICTLYIHTYLVIHKHVHNIPLNNAYPCGDNCELVTIRPTHSLLKQEHFLSLVPPFMAWGPYGCNTR